MIGLDGAGKTTALYRLKYDQVLMMIMHAYDDSDSDDDDNVPVHEHCPHRGLQLRAGQGHRGQVQVMMMM